MESNKIIIKKKLEINIIITKLIKKIKKITIEDLKIKKGAMKIQILILKNNCKINAKKQNSIKMSKNNC